MTRSELDIRPATAEDLRERYPEGVFSAKAWIAHHEGVRAALWGLMNVKGRWVLFFDAEDPVRPFKKTMLRESRKTMDVAREMGIKTVYAVWDEKEPMGEKWMFRLGFTREGNKFIWRGE